MSFANPTPLKLGMTGNLGGPDYRVVGRVVMGMEVDGETYYWNEFNLQSDAGESATLVFEQTESGGQWRLFTLFEPEYPITAEDAATKCVGDPINLDGTDTRVTLVDQSRVYYIEGQAPEGVELGDIANYFNTEAGDHMDVVSWTGAEVECYHGVNLPQSVVFTAFNLRPPAFSSLLQTADASYTAPPLAPRIAAVIVTALVVIGGFLYLTRNPRPPAVIRTPAPPSPLKAGTAGKLKGTDFRIQSHAVVEVALVGHKFQQHEYPLASGSGDQALLIYGSTPGAKDWTLFTPLHPAEPLTPQQAGAVRLGQTVNVDGFVAQASDLFQSTIRLVENPTPGSPAIGDVLYCFAGKGDYVRLLVRWNAGRIEFFRGSPLPEKDVTAAFKPPAP